MQPRQHILLGICGSIAAYKSLDLIRKLKQARYRVTCLMTESAKKFISPLTVATISEEAVLDSLWDNPEIEHLQLDKSPQVFMLAPASANMIAKCALGLADDLISSTWLNFSGKKCIAPAMHTQMWENPITQQHIHTLKEHQVFIMPPALGKLACGDYGKGRLPDSESLFKMIENLCFEPLEALQGKKVLVTAGPMKEKIDAVRHIQNQSSGQLGHQITQLCATFGAEVSLYTSVPFKDPQILSSIDYFENFQDLESLMDKANDFDYLFMTAAVSDYCVQKENSKLQRKATHTLELVGTKDLLQAYQTKHSQSCYSVGFCLIDTLNNTQKIKAKQNAKNVPMMVANTADNIAANTRNFVIYSDEQESLDNLSVAESAYRIVNHCIKKSIQTKKELT